jgi:hypothetical protein
MNANQDIPSLIEQLQHKSSPKRRAAAKKIRKLAANEAGPALLAALKKELNDKRTWETQYQMIMALGEATYTESLDFLLQLANRDFEATMVYVAIGDAIARLDFAQHNDIDCSINIFKNTSNSMLKDGILRAIAMLQLTPKTEAIDTIINYGLQLEIEDNSRVWIAAAAPGWPLDTTKIFLNECMASENQQIKRAAEAALKNKFLKWSPL